jgi:hypothetical protein
MRFLHIIFVPLALGVYAQGYQVTTNITDAKLRNSQERLRQMTFTTPAYQNEALRLIIDEANRVARELQLHEPLPITKSNLIETYIGPPWMAKRNRGVGNVTTSNYTYFVTVGNKFSFLTKRNLERDYDPLETKYHWPLSRIDTNAAYQLATQWLTAVSMDVDGLNRDCYRHIRPWIPAGAKDYFVPVYRISWGKEGEPIALVELFLPTKELRDLRVEKSEFILRKPIQIANHDLLLSKTNVTAVTNK